MTQENKTICHFHQEWEQDYLFCYGWRKVSLLTLQHFVTTPKKVNLEWNFSALHGKYSSDYSPNIEFRKKKLQELKSGLSA